RRQQKRLRRRSVQNGQSGKMAGAPGSKSDAADAPDDLATSAAKAQAPPRAEMNLLVARENKPGSEQLNTKLSPVQDQYESENQEPNRRSDKPQDGRRDRWSIVSQSIASARSRRRAFQQSAMAPRRSPAVAAMAGKSSSMSDSDQGSSPRTSYARSYSADSPKQYSRSSSLGERRLSPRCYRQPSADKDTSRRVSPSRDAQSAYDGDKTRRVSPSRDGQRSSGGDATRRVSPSRDVKGESRDRLRRVSPSRDGDVTQVRHGDSPRRTSPSRDVLQAHSGDRHRRGSPSRVRKGSPNGDPKRLSPEDNTTRTSDRQRRTSLPSDVTGARDGDRPRRLSPSDDVNAARDGKGSNDVKLRRGKDRGGRSDGRSCSDDEKARKAAAAAASGRNPGNAPDSLDTGSASRRSRPGPRRQCSYDEKLHPDRSARPGGTLSSPEKSAADTCCSSPTPYTCVTQALRNVASPHEYATSPDTGGASSACTCATPDTCIAKSALLGVTDCCACATAIERAWEWTKEAWDYNGNLIHTILHKPTRKERDIKRESHPGAAGDQVVAWGGHPLSGTSFEQALSLVTNTRSDVVHLLTLPKDLIGRPSSPMRSSSRHSDFDHPVSPHGHSPITWGSESGLSMGHVSDSSTAEIGRESRQMCGEILLSLEYDPPTAVLYVTIVKGRGLALPGTGSTPDVHPHGPGQGQMTASLHKTDQGPEHIFEPRPGSRGAEQRSAEYHQNKRARKTLDLPQVTVKSAALSGSETEDTEHDVTSSAFPSPFVLVHLLPHRRSREAHKTEIRKYNRRPKWERTFVYDSFTITEVVTVWSREDGADEFMGEILLELREWRHYTQAIWCRLYDHDDNSSPLPRPRQLMAHDSVVSSASASSSCYDDHSRSSDLQDAHRLSPTAGGSQTGSTAVGTRDLHAQPDTFTTKLGKVTKGMVRNRLVSRVSTSFSHADRKEMGKGASPSSVGSDESSPGDLSRRRSASETHVNNHDDRMISPGISRHPSYGMDLLAPPRPLSRANSSSSFFMSDDSSDGDLYSPTSVTPDRPAPEGDDITSILGPGQVPPKPSSETLVCGDVKLGLAVSKGQLEVDIICVRGLHRTPHSHLPAYAPDTYVKTYLVEGHKTIQKKKTQVVKASADPIFRRKIKYSACNVHGRHMRIVVWERPRNFERKQCLGETVVKLDSLDLSVHTIMWYKLFPLNSTDLGSTDSLSQW
ncbi:hypothetical protein BaRGS_00032685, partial [Batillaria attramentaria]